MIAFIDEHRGVYGVEPICRLLPIAPSRIMDAGIQPSAGSVGDSYDNALAETINGPYKAEVVHRRSWRTLKDVERATLEWVHWYNHHRLLGPLGYVSPAEAEDTYNRNVALSARAA